MADENGKDTQKYDFSFIAQSLGLLEIAGGAVNPGAIVQIELHYEGSPILHRIALHGGKDLFANDYDLVALEALIRLRKDEARKAQKDAIRQQIIDQQEAVAEIQRGIATPAPSPILIGQPRKRGQ